MKINFNENITSNIKLSFKDENTNKFFKANKNEIMIYKFYDDYENCHTENLKIKEVLDIWGGAENE